MSVTNISAAVLSLSVICSTSASASSISLTSFKVPSTPTSCDNDEIPYFSSSFSKLLTVTNTISIFMPVITLIFFSSGNLD